MEDDSKADELGGAPPPSATRELQDAQVEELLGSLPLIPPGESWNEEVLRRVAEEGPAPEPSPWWTWPRVWRWAAGGMVLAVAAVVLVMQLRPREEPELEWTTSNGVNVRDPSAVSVGQWVTVKARPAGVGDLRVYRHDGVLLGRCPSGPRCTSRSDARLQVIELELDRSAPYHMILVVDAGTALPDAPMGPHLDAAHAAGGRVRNAEIKVE